MAKSRAAIARTGLANLVVAGGVGANLRLRDWDLGGDPGFPSDDVEAIVHLARKVVALDDRRSTPAHQLNDGQNYHPTNRLVLWGHHFAAITGAGPLVGPMLAAQYGWAPGLLWLVAGVCLASSLAFPSRADQ